MKTVYIPACVTHGGVDDLVYNDFFVEEGADVIMVKPALAYLDIVKMAKQQFATPLCVYNVSGEYSMLKLAVAQGLVKEEVIYETMLAFKRAGADIIITYFALDIAKQLRKGEC